MCGYFNLLNHLLALKNYVHICVFLVSKFCVSLCLCVCVAIKSHKILDTSSLRKSVVYFILSTACSMATLRNDMPGIYLEWNLQYLLVATVVIDYKRWFFIRISDFVYVSAIMAAGRKWRWYRDEHCRGLPESPEYYCATPRLHHDCHNVYVSIIFVHTVMSVHRHFPPSWTSDKTLCDFPANDKETHKASFDTFLENTLCG